VIKLEVLNTAFKGKRFGFRHGLTVGSGPGCTIRAQHKDMLETHARFYIGDNGKPMAEACDEKINLQINGKDIVRTELRHLDELTVGPLKFKVMDIAQMSQSSLRLDQLIEGLSKQGDEIHDFAQEDLFYLSTKDPTLREAVSFSIPSKDRFIEQAQVFIARLVKQSSMHEDQVEGFMTCAKELILNAHRHGHQFNEGKKIVLRYRDVGSRISLTIEDEGTGFDHKAVIEGTKNKDAAKAARERYQAGGFGGLGFQLVTRLASDLKYNDTGNVVTFSMNKEPTHT
jgi:anti-sigma regulatory factor (Ser/Thr protein kinase)